MSPARFVRLMDGPVLWLAEKTRLHRIYLWTMRNVRDDHWFYSQFYLLIPGIPGLLCAPVPDLLRAYFGEISKGSMEEYVISVANLLWLIPFLSFGVISFQVFFLVAFGANGMIPRKRWINYQNWLIAELEAMGEPKPQKPSDTP